MSQEHDIDSDIHGEDFESMLNRHLNSRDNFSTGDEVNGTIVLITQDSVLVDISGKSEAIIDLSEFLERDGTHSLRKGDRISAVVASVRGGEIKLTSRIGRGFLNQELVRKAYEDNIPVTGTITSAVRGGYRVSVGGIPCFCPFSQIETPENESDLLNTTTDFKIIEYRENGKNIIVSRKSVVQMIRERRLAEILATMKAGDTVTGIVASVQQFGVLVDLDGVEALIPRSEASWSRKCDLSVFAPGEKITARVLSLETEGRIVLSLKQMTAEPWERVREFSEGQTVAGRVSNTIRSGAFIEIAPGLEGFLPLSRMSMTKKINDPGEVVSIGDSVQVRLLEIRPSEKKMLLELVTGEADPWQASIDDAAGEIHTGVVETAKPNGANVRLANGMLGFLPKSEMTSLKGEVQNAYPAGREVKVAVREIEREGKKLILSEKAADRKKELNEFEEFNRRQAQAGAGGTTLGSIFKDRFSEISGKIGK
jgi:small subunit ribosomal protein S1